MFLKKFMHVLCIFISGYCTDIIFFFIILKILIFYTKLIIKAYYKFFNSYFLKKLKNTKRMAIII